MRTVAIIQARMGSSRLPGKSLMSLAGRPLLEHVIERVQATAGLDAVILATSCADRDDPLLAVAAQRGIRTYRGSEWDVLGRVCEAAAQAEADVILRVTADCPFWDPAIGGHVLAEFGRCQMDYLSNDTSSSGYPDGTDAEVFTREALTLAGAQGHRRTDREHVTPWMRRLLRCGVVLCADGNHVATKLSVDTQADYAMAQRVAQRLRGQDFAMRTTLAAYEEAR